MTRPSAIGLASILLLIPTKGHGQYAWGLAAGKDFFFGGEGFGGEGRGIHGVSAFSLGLASADIDKDGSTWRGTLLWVRREFAYDGWLRGSTPERYGKLNGRIDLVELAFDARIALSQGSTISFDIEPVIDYRIAQEVSGIAYTVNYTSNDTVFYDQDRAVDRNFSGARLRCGVSGDVPVGANWWLTFGGYLGWGADIWLTDQMLPSWDCNFRVGVLYYPTFRGR